MSTETEGWLNISELSRLTEKTRELIINQLVGVPFEAGAHGAKRYRPSIALTRIYHGRGGEVNKDEPLSEAESRRQLNVSRKVDVDLGIEIKRRQRIPLEIAEEVNDRVFSNVAGIIKSMEGKPMTAEAISDALTELRSCAAGLREWVGGSDD